MSEKIRVYHGASEDFDGEPKALNRFGNTAAFAGLWVTTDIDEARYFIGDGPRPRFFVYDLDITGAIPYDEDIHDDWEEEDLEEALENGLTTILGAEGPDNHCVHAGNTWPLTLIEVIPA